MAYPTKMRRYKIAACILLILSVFSSVLAAPIPLAVQEVREAYTNSDAVDGGDNVIIEMGKRSGEEVPSVAQAQQEASSSTDWFWKVWTPSQHSSSAPNYASGTPTEIQTLPARPPQTAKGGMPLGTIPEGVVAQQNSQAKLKNIFKTIFSKLSRLKFWRRISGPTGGVVTEE
jgi:hypothetical protein